MLVVWGFVRHRGVFLTATSRCTGLAFVVFLLSSCAFWIIQGIIVLRVWYLYTHRTLGRVVVIACFVVSIVADCVLLSFNWKDTRPVFDDQLGCLPQRGDKSWRIFLVHFVLHTILFIATSIPVIRMWHCKKDGFVMLRILRDGGIFYLVVLGSIGFSIIGTLPGRSVMVSQPATSSGFILNITSVAVAHLMLSIQSLAAGLRVEPTWLLSHAELSRVRWRRGANESELIVEIESAEAPDRMVELSALGDARALTKQKVSHTSGDSSQLSVLGQYGSLAPVRQGV